MKVSFSQWIRTWGLGSSRLLDRCALISKNGRINASGESGGPKIGIRTDPVVADWLVCCQLLVRQYVRKICVELVETETRTTKEYR